MSPNSDSYLVWIDLEMTGLVPERHGILEIATIITDQDLNEVAAGPVFAITHTMTELEAMDQWNRSTHGKSGLWDRALNHGVALAEAEQRTLDFAAAHLAPGKSPMCGNSICQDRRFLARHMPALERFFHYRNLDVSTIKELARRWAPGIAKGVVKAGNHTALSDIRESIGELRYYRRFMGPLAGG